MTKGLYYAFIDTETTGVPQQPSRRRFYHYTLLDKYDPARIVSIAIVFYDMRGKKVREFYQLIKPEGFTIPPSEYHDITQEDATEKGVKLIDFMDEVMPFLQKTYALVGHNIMFDVSVLASELFRAGYPEKAFGVTCMRLFDTQAVAYYSRLPCGLKQLYEWLTNCLLTNHHNALYDANHCAECFFIMKKRRLFVV